MEMIGGAILVNETSAPLTIPSLDQPPANWTQPFQPVVFVPGRPFSFLTQGQNDSVLARIRIRNEEIHQLTAGRGECRMRIDRVRLKRQGTWAALEQLGQAIGMNIIARLTAQDIEEIESFNCSQYRNRTIRIDSDIDSRFSAECVIDLPC